MATKSPSVTEKLNRIADELEQKAKVSKSEDGKTIREALDRVAEAVKKLP